MTVKCFLFFLHFLALSSVGLFLVSIQVRETGISKTKKQIPLKISSMPVFMILSFPYTFFFFLLSNDICIYKPDSDKIFPFYIGLIILFLVTWLLIYLVNTYFINIFLRFFQTKWVIFIIRVQCILTCMLALVVLYIKIYQLE
jgi:hypothetical protein